MLASRRRLPRRLLHTFNFGAHAYRLLIAAALTLAVSALVLLVNATALMPAPQVHSRQLRPNPATPTATSPASATPTNTVPATPPSISLLSPTSGLGPVDAHVTIQGSNFTGSSPSIFASKQPDCSSSDGVLPVSATISGGMFTTTFLWPATFSTGIYYICAAGMSSSNAVYQVQSSSPPALSLSTSSVAIGQPLTIQGSNFWGISAGALWSFTGAGGGQLQVNPDPPVVDSTGSFSVTWTPPQGTTTGSVTIRVSAGAENGYPAVLQASATVTIQGAATATVTVAASPSVGQGGGGIRNPNSSNTSLIVIVLLITGILIAMVAIVGIVIYLTMRRRGTQAGQWQKSGYGGYGSYGDTTMQSSSPYPPETDTFGWPLAGSQGSQWDDADPQPGPDWQGRPMSGYYPGYDEPTQSSTSYRQRSQPESPIDPWDDPPPTRYGTNPRQNPRYRGGADAPYPDDDQWPDLDNNGYRGR